MEEREWFICEIIKAIKRRKAHTALNKRKAMNKILSVHTCPTQCLYQFHRDGKCYHGQSPFKCKTFEAQTKGIDVDTLSEELKERAQTSMVAHFREIAEANKQKAMTVADKAWAKKKKEKTLTQHTTIRRRHAKRGKDNTGEPTDRKRGNGVARIRKERTTQRIKKSKRTTLRKNKSKK